MTRAPWAVAGWPSSEALLDAALVAVALGGSLVQMAHGGLDPARAGVAGLDGVGVAVAACSAVPLVAWRRSPLGVFALCAGATVVLAGLGYPLQLALGAAIALYLLAARREPRTVTAWTAVTTATVWGLFAAYLGAAAATQGAFPGTELLHSGLAWTVAWFAGERTRLRRDQVAELQARARRAAHEAEQERRLAAAEERSRIARDLHDSAGHAISVIAVRAGAARLRHSQDPDRSLPALEAIEELARRTASEIDHIVDGLRDDRPRNGAVDPPPGLASLDTLLAHQAAAGLDVTITTTGAPRAVSGAADQATYRVLQEALTNAARHGTGGAHVDLTFGATALELTVTNPALADGSSRSGGGHGLVGMRERLALVGGDLDAARAGDTFRVHARIPYAGGGGPEA